MAKNGEGVGGNRDGYVKYSNQLRLQGTSWCGFLSSVQVPTDIYTDVGKTTVARKMGSVYNDMGILTSNEVIECSASDLVGQYIGHTGPKTRKLFEKVLGGVLFIDEAYRLGEGQFAREAMDELVGLLTHERFRGKLIIILAGYDQEINSLLQVNTGLSSRFPEEIVFEISHRPSVSTYWIVNFKDRISIFPDYVMQLLPFMRSWLVPSTSYPRSLALETHMI